MKPDPTAPITSPDDTAPAPAPRPFVKSTDRAGRALAVLLEVEDQRADQIRVSLDGFGAVRGSGFLSGTLH